MNSANPKVDVFLSNIDKWQKELQKLREIILSCGLTEEVKWNVPIYTFENKNIAGINGLKDFCALAFFKGVFLKDTEKILHTPGKHVQGARWLKFTTVREITKLTPVIKAYIFEAIEIEKAGLKIPRQKPSDLVIPDEFNTHLKKNPVLKKAFNALTPGRQKGYIFYFSAPKLSKNREARIEKYIPQILDGKGIDD